jgi:S-DNA-T family DNA segregation ATPase FtsK/SpoIIIE
VLSAGPPRPVDRARARPRARTASFSVDLSRRRAARPGGRHDRAGKSELLQTLIASLALANRPDELTFVLVDYKGGAAFGPCARLPHTVGLVTDLDGSRVERALASLAAELSRRETVLQSVGAKDLEEHRRLVGSGTPLPRLVIVVDEFASLVEDLPDFVGGLVAIAMRGRSLGVHLVLATQRPEGVVSPDIRANTNLRLCLAVTRDSESRDVLDSPLAARISRTTPGRAWARTGHADLTAFQAGRVGGRRPSVVARGRSADVRGAAAGRPRRPLPRSRAAERDEQEVTDLSLLVDACAAARPGWGCLPSGHPWLPPLPARLVLADLPPAPDPARRPARAGAGSGVRDGRRAGRAEPAALVPGPRPVLTPDDRGRGPLRPDDGAAHAGGRARRCASPDDVHLYAVDPGGTGLGPLTALPHTGAVVGRDAPTLDRVLGCWPRGRPPAGRPGRGRARRPGRAAGRRSAGRTGCRTWCCCSTGGRRSCPPSQDVDAGRLVDLVHRLLREGPSVGCTSC